MTLSHPYKLKQTLNGESSLLTDHSIEIDSGTKELCIRIEVFHTAGVPKGRDSGFHTLRVVVGVCDVVIVQPIKRQRERRKVEGIPKQKSN